MKHLIAILGPTASGKTSVSIALAKHFNTEILSCDSRQFFKEMSIGTAKPSSDELASVKHHFIGHITIKDDHSAGMYENDALAMLTGVYENHDTCVLTGGSGLYANALLYGLEDLPKDDKIRSEWNQVYEKEGIIPLQEKVKELDPTYYETVDVNNHIRLIRAIEVSLASGKPYSSLRTGKRKNRPFKIIQIGLDLDRDELYKRINQRVDQMIGDGLESEAKELFGHKELNALQTVGYSELFDYFEGKCTFDEAVQAIKQNTRRYAKRQMTWLRKQTNIEWYSPNQISEMIAYIETKIHGK